MPRYRRPDGRYGKPRYNQAAKIVRRFGGELSLSRALGIHRTSVYRWQMQRPYGSDGIIPGPMADKIRQVARLNGVLLRETDWVPELISYGDDHED